MMKEDQEKIDMAGFQEMLRKRRAPAQSNRRKATQGQQSTGEPPEWLVTSQLRKSYFRPDENVPTRVRIIPQLNGNLFYEYHSAWVKRDGRNNMLISNAWNGERPLPCLLYDKYESAYNEGGRDAADNFKSSRQFAATVVVLESFYEVEKQGKKNPYFIYKQAPSPDRYGRVVDDPQYESSPKVFGRVLHWSMYSRQKENFENNLYQALRTCAHCKEGHVEAVSFACEKCENVFGDLRTEKIHPEELAFLRSGKNVECDKCEHIAPPMTTKECVVQKGYGSSARFEKGCENPTLIEPGHAFDLVIKKVPAGNSFAIEILDIDIVKPIEELPDYQENPRISTAAPMDFDRFFGRMSLRDQAFALGIENPYSDDVEEIIDQYLATAAEDEDADSIPF